MGAGADIRNVVVIVTIGLSLAACAGSSGPREAGAFGKSRGYYKVGAPYQVNGVWYSPRVDYNYDETGTASWYGEAFNGRSTANGEIFDLNQVSAAHKTLQLPSVVEVTNLQNNRALKVRVNDRGPFAGDRLIDLSRRAAQLLGFERAGTAPVRVRIIKDESIKVAEAAMRGDIGSARLASEPRPVQTQLAATRPRPSAIWAAPPTGIAESAVAAPASTPTAPAPVVLAGSPAPVPSPPAPSAEPPQDASERSALPAENAPMRRPAWPSLIASAQAATPAAALPTRQPMSTAAPPGRIFIQAGMFAVAENANRLRARFAGLTGTEVVRVSVNGNELYRVRLGPVTSETAARQLLAKLAESGIPNARLVSD